MLYGERTPALHRVRNQACRSSYMASAVEKQFPFLAKAGGLACPHPMSKPLLPLSHVTSLRKCSLTGGPAQAKACDVVRARRRRRRQGKREGDGVCATCALIHL